MMTLQMPREVPLSQQSSKQATLNHLTHCAPDQHRPSNRSAPLHHQSPSSISHLPTCGDTCLQHHHCGVHSLWSTWGSVTSNPSNILSADASFSSTNSAAAATAHHHNQPSVYCPGLCCRGTEGPARPNPAQ